MFQQCVYMLDACCYALYRKAISAVSVGGREYLLKPNFSYKPMRWCEHRGKDPSDPSCPYGRMGHSVYASNWSLAMSQCSPYAISMSHFHGKIVITRIVFILLHWERKKGNKTRSEPKSVATLFNTSELNYTFQDTVV